MIYFLDNSLQLQKIVTSKNVISAIHEHELNGLIRADVELDLSYANKFLILGIDHVGYYYKDEFYLHKIQRVEYDHVNETATVVLRHIFFEDMIFGKLIRDVRPQNQDALTVSRQTIDANTRWQTIMTDVTGRLSTNFYWQVPYEVIEFMTENYRIEYLPKILFDGQSINGFQLHLANKIGEDKNIRIPYGSRVLDLKYEEDYSEIITKLVVHGKGEEVGDGYGRRINISDVNFSRNGVESPVGSLYLEDETITNTYGNDGQTPREGREVFEDIENANELAEAGYQHYLQVSRPQMLFTADVADIGDVGIGDSVMIIRREYDVYFNARIHKLSVDLLYPEDAQVELGDYKHFKESKVARKTREKNNRVQGQLSDRITRLKREANDRFDNEVAQWKSEYEQALIDVHAEIEADRENMTNLIEDTRTDFTDNLNAEVAQTKEYAEQQAQEKADSVQTNLDSFKDSHQQLYDEVTENVLDIDTFLGDKSVSLKQQFDKVHTDFGTLQTDLEGVESDLTATKSDLQNQLDEARAELEGLEVGGRNRFAKSKVILTNNLRYDDQLDLYYNVRYNRSFSIFGMDSFGLELNQKYILAYEIKSNNPELELMTNTYINGSAISVDNNSPELIEGEWVKVYTEPFLYHIDDTSAVHIYFNQDLESSRDIEIRNVQINRGTILQDYQVAPEDTEEKITTLNQQIEFIDGQLSAKLEQTDIEPINNKITEYGNSLTANAQSIESLISKSELHDSDITKWSNKTAETAEGLEQTISRVSSAEGKLSNAESAIEANADGLALRVTKTEVEQAIDGIEVGGRNLLPAFTSNRWSHQNRTEIEDYSLYIPSGYAGNSILFMDVEKHTNYTMTFNSDYARYYIYEVLEDGSLGSIIRTNTGSETYTFNTEDISKIRVALNTFSGNVSEEKNIWDLKLEKGNKATDWTPAPEDTDAKISTVSSVLEIEAGKVETLISKTDGHDTQLTNIVADYNSIEQTVAANDEWLGTHGSNVLQTIEGFSQKVWLTDVAEINPNLIPISPNAWEDGAYYSTGANNNGATEAIRLKRDLAVRVFRDVVYTFNCQSLESSNISQWMIVNFDTEDSSVNEVRYIIRGNAGSLRTVGNRLLVVAFARSGEVVVLDSFENNPSSRINIKLERGSTASPLLKVLSHIEQQANEVSIKVSELGSINGEEIITESDISVRSDQVLIGSTSIGSETLASIISVSPSAIDMITDELNLTGNLNVKGQIEAISLDAIDANFARVQTAILKSNVITSDHIQVDTALVDKMFATSARIDELITKIHFVNEMHALTLNVVDLNASEIRTRLLTADTIEASWIKSGTALLDRVFSSTAMFERMMAKSAFITTLSTVTLDLHELTIWRPDGVAFVQNGMERFGHPVPLTQYIDYDVTWDGRIYETQYRTAKTILIAPGEHAGRYYNLTVIAGGRFSNNWPSTEMEVIINVVNRPSGVSWGTSHRETFTVSRGSADTRVISFPLGRPTYGGFLFTIQFRKTGNSHDDDVINLRTGRSWVSA